MKRCLVFVWAIALLVFLAGCSMAPSPVDIATTSTGIDAQRGVALLAPAGRGEPGDAFDANVDLTIEVFELIGDAPAGDSVGPAFRTSDGSLQIRDDHYFANWSTRDLNVPNGTRLRVEFRLWNAPLNGPACADGVNVDDLGCLAYFDVVLVENARDARRSATTDEDAFMLVNGRNLPVRLYVEVGAADVTRPESIDAAVRLGPNGWTYHDPTGLVVTFPPLGEGGDALVGVGVRSSLPVGTAPTVEWITDALNVWIKGTPNWSATDLVIFEMPLRVSSSESLGTRALITIVDPIAMITTATELQSGVVELWEDGTAYLGARIEEGKLIVRASAEYLQASAKAGWAHAQQTYTDAKEALVSHWIQISHDIANWISVAPQLHFVDSSKQNSASTDACALIGAEEVGPGFSRGNHDIAVVFIHGWQLVAGFPLLGDFSHMDPHCDGWSKMVAAAHAPPSRWSNTNPSSDWKHIADRADLFTYRYDSDDRIADNGRHLLTALQSVLGDYNHIVLVGHSMGGLVASEAQRTNLVNSVGIPIDGIVALSTPFMGAPLRCTHASADRCLLHEGRDAVVPFFQPEYYALSLGTLDATAAYSHIEPQLAWPPFTVNPANPYLVSLWSEFPQKGDRFDGLHSIYGSMPFREALVSIWNVTYRILLANGWGDNDSFIARSSMLHKRSFGLDTAAARVDNTPVHRFHVEMNKGKGGSDLTYYDPYFDTVAAVIVGFLPDDQTLTDAPLVGVTPGSFDLDGGTFTITVSPRDQSGNLIQGDFSVSDFSFHSVSAALMPGGVPTPGTAIPTGVTTIAPGVSDDLALVLNFDASGSMSWNDPGRRRVTAGKQLVEQLSSEDEAAILEFASSTRVLQTFTSDKTLLNQAIDRVSASGSTYMYRSLQTSLNMLATRGASTSAVVVLTDGIANDGSLYTTVVAQAANQGTPIFTVGLGAGTNVTELQNLARATGGTFGSAGDADGLQDIFDAIGFGISQGRVIVEGRGEFSTSLPGPGLYQVSGVLVTLLGGASVETPFSFSVNVTSSE